MGQQPEKNFPAIQAQRQAEIVRSYMAPDEQDWARLRALLNTKGFELTTTQGEMHLQWPDQQADFAVFDQIVDLISQTVTQDDTEFALEVRPRIIDISCQSSLFCALNDDNIERSSAHTMNPFWHTMEVVRRLNTENIEHFIRFLLRFLASMHDTGKVFIAHRDIFQDHATISYLIVREYFISHLRLSPEWAELFSSIVRYHHILELVGKGLFTEEQVRQLLPHFSQLMMVGVLTLADASSVEAYKPYAYESGAVCLQLLVAELEQLEAETVPLIKAFIGAIFELARELEKEVDEVLVALKEMLGLGDDFVPEMTPYAAS